MLRFVGKRFVQSLVSLFVISLLIFGAMYAIGDPVALLLPRTASMQARENLRHDLGLDLPLPVQYARFIGRVVRGDFGKSFYDGVSVIKLLGERAPATIELAAASLMLAVIIGIPLGILCGARPDALVSRAILGGSILGISMPTFWLGLLFIMLFAVNLNWLPTSDRGETRELFGMQWSLLTLDGWRHMILPAVTLALHHLAMLIRLVRSEIMETLHRPFIRVVRARGVSEAQVVGKHALRNSMILIVTVTGVEFGQLLAFSVITETIFVWPGLGRLLMRSITEQDQPVIIAYLILTGAVFLTINFLVDLTYALIDPRVRLASARGTPGS